MISELLNRVFSARNIAHFTHLTTDKYSEHIALNEFYDNVIDAVDELIECYIGQFSEVPEYDVVSMKAPENIVSFLRDESDWIEANRDEISGKSEAVASLVDVLVSVYLRTIYKLERFTI